ncbi:TRAP transporter substrate-binding protein DctP [Ornithinibacillus halophilus]|uniref:TRAP-type C4-dicarboxylate transport system, substrate-binding protein n=1 Tax=Ornithinibacillus halophilus TaxID=930117 RepID=A0A1M5GSP8_9BACI|nr:TRAP transporter substrate-binding protein DctP [Ornithinibacillus halophilus]SHG06637.1 TRAP-type C4-dicarboxylate transport system, substrate-binding protein [Ornithinibacillus halophilus]
MKKYSILSLMGLLILSIALVGCQSSENNDSSSSSGDDNYGPPGEVTKWVMQPAFDSSDAGWDNGVVPWIEDVEEATEGTVEIELLPAGSVTSGDEAFGAAVAGMTDVYAGWASVYGGNMPEGMLAFGMSMGADTSEEAWEAMWGDDYRIGDLVQEAAHELGIHWAGWTNQGPNAAFTNFEINQLEDYEGRKMRAGGPQAIFLEAMGGVPVSLPGGEIYMSIDLGTIEGTFWDTGGIDDMKFQEVVDYAILPGWTPAQHQEIFVNLDSWNALNEWQQDQIEGIFESNYFKTSDMHTDNVEEALEIFEAAGGEIITLSDEEVARMREKAIEDVWPKIGEQSELNAEGVEIWKQFLQDKGKIE